LGSSAAAVMIGLTVPARNDTAMEPEALGNLCPDLFLLPALKG
jgi:hypothetical protein